MNLKPMLAVDLDLTKVRYPLVVSMKYDGVRCYISGEVVYSRTGKSIPNASIQEMFKGLPEGTEGELVINYGKCKATDVTSLVMSHTKPCYGVVTLKQFDNICRQGVRTLFVKQEVIVFDEVELLTAYERAIDLGYEGLIARDPKALYKHGRSTMVDQGLMRMKPRADAEAKILGFQMLESVHKASMLGALTLEGINGKYKGVQFSCGTGFNDLQRIDIWDNKEKYRKMIVKYSYMDYGAKDLPRHPVFEGFRHEDDL